MEFNPRAIRFGYFRQDLRYRTTRPSGSGDYLLVYTLKGGGRIGAAGARRDLREGEAVLYAPGSFQSYGTSSAVGFWELAWAHFAPRPHWAPLLQWPQWREGIGIVSLGSDDARKGLQTALLQAVSLSRRPWGSSLAFALNRLEEALLWADLAAREDRSLTADRRIRQAVDYLSRNLDKPFSLADVASAAGLSPSRFSHLFKAQTGRAPQRYSEDLRMAQAVFLLRESDLAVAEVAAQCGYEDPLYFSRRFRRRVGRAPKAFRAEG